MSSKTFKRAYYKGTYYNKEQLTVVFDDGQRVIVKNEEGNVMFNGSRWLFDQCWKRNYFVDS